MYWPNLFPTFILFVYSKKKREDNAFLLVLLPLQNIHSNIGHQANMDLVVINIHCVIQ